MATKKRRFDWGELLSGMAEARALEYGASRNIYLEGDSADSVLFLLHGKVKLSVTSKQGREAITAVLDSGDFFGEGCLAGQPLRITTAMALADCSVARLPKSEMVRLLHEQHEISEMFAAQLLSRSIRYESDLVDQLLSSSEKRLARIFLVLSHFGRDTGAQPVLPMTSDEDLAKMVGTTRSRVSHLMNKFRELGFIDYGDEGGLTVNRGLLSVVLHD